MTRDDFMKEARETTRTILQGKENSIMNLVQRAWAEGKRNAEVETLRAAIDEALDKREPKTMEDMDMAKESDYPAWRDWLRSQYPMMGHYTMTDILESPIPADIAEKLGAKPKEGTCTD